MNPITFKNDVINGLVKNQKELPCKYFYDRVGSEIYEKITQLDEYYLTNTETQIIEFNLEEMLDLMGTSLNFIELGSGSASKTNCFLKRLTEGSTYLPIDISKQQLFEITQTLSKCFPHINVIPYYADFSEPINLPDELNSNFPNAVFFPGSTIGNFTPPQCQNLLVNIHKLIDKKGGLLIGVDMIKETEILEKAYNDEQGVTRDFNLNMLNRINNELNGEIQIDFFEHQAIFNQKKNRIEMHLVSLKKQEIKVDDFTVKIEEKESIITEYSHKFSHENFINIAEKAGFTQFKKWSDENGWFSVYYLS